MDSEKYVCGYPVEELIVFADACRKAGVTNEQLHDFVINATSGYKYGRNELIDILKDTYDDFLKGYEEIRSQYK